MEFPSPLKNDLWMKSLKFDAEFETIYVSAILLAKSVQANSLLVLVDGPTDWDQLGVHAHGVPVVLAADRAEQLEGAAEFGFPQRPVGHA